MSRETEMVGEYILAKERREAHKKGQKDFGELIIRLINDDFKNSTETKRRYLNLIREEMARLD